MLLKRGHLINELTKYRYDVVLHVANEAPRSVPEVWLDWEQHELSVASIRLMLENEAPEVLGVVHVPNGRLAGDLLLLTS